MNGFNVSPDTKITVSIQTPSPRQEIIEVVRKTWNGNKEIQKLKGIVKEIILDRGFWDNPEVYVGEWFEGKFTIRDNLSLTPAHYKAITIHEMVGHAFWDWARKNRSRDLAKFVLTADQTPPLTEYIKDNEVQWREESQTLYANEQHSAMAEWMNKTPVHHKYLITPPKELQQLYVELHRD